MLMDALTSRHDNPYC